MAIHLGANQYGKAESRVVRIYRDTARHQIRDLNVSSALRGHFEDAHTTGDQADVLPTDTQKNTAFAFAKEKGVGAIEDFALTLGDHFLDADSGRRAAPGSRSRSTPGSGSRSTAPATTTRSSGPAAASATTVVNVEGRGDERKAYVVSGISDLVVLKSTGSEFHGFLKDKYTTLPETERPHPRDVAGRPVALRPHRCRLGQVVRRDQGDCCSSSSPRSTASRCSRRCTAWARRCSSSIPEVAEIKFSAPNKHHFLVDLSPFGLENPNEVFIAADRPYGLIEATVVRDDATDAGSRLARRPRVLLSRDP